MLIAFHRQIKWWQDGDTGKKNLCHFLAPMTYAIVVKGRRMPFASYQGRRGCGRSVVGSGCSCGMDQEKVSVSFLIGNSACTFGPDCLGFKF